MLYEPTAATVSAVESIARGEFCGASLSAVYLYRTCLASGCEDARRTHVISFVQFKPESVTPNFSTLDRRMDRGGMRLCALGASRRLERRMENLRNKCKLGSDAKQRSLMKNERHWGAGFLSSSFIAASANINLGKFPSYLCMEQNASMCHWQIKMSDMINLLLFNYALKHSYNHVIYVFMLISYIFRQGL